MSRMIFALAVLIWPVLVAAQAPSERLSDSILAIHNRERGLVGVPPLVWNERLAADAAAYGPHLVALGRLEHSPGESRAGAGENLAGGVPGYHSPENLAELWVGEKRFFVNGVFPNVGTTGSWRAVGHYTAMIWRNTASVGCATAAGGGKLYLICRYAPAGNVIGQRVY